MGYAIAAQLAARGARVVLVSGPTALPVPHGVERIDVQTAAQMYEACARIFDSCDGAVMCAAVADYTPARPSSGKIKKNDGRMDLQLIRTQDIAASLGVQKGERLLVGFALETDDEEANAQAKLVRKNFDFIVLNSLRDEGAGFGTETNKVTIFTRDGVRHAYPLITKTAAASAIADHVEEFFQKTAVLSEKNQRKNATETSC